MLRRSLLAFAVFASFAGPCLAGDLLTGGVPLVTTNSASNTNVAAGIGNSANQSVFQSQNGSFSPSRRGGSFTSNDASNTNVAAGLFNSANQNVIQSQNGSFGHGGPTFNSASNTNLAAGIGNSANQSVFQSQSGSVRFPSLSHH